MRLRISPLATMGLLAVACVDLWLATVIVGTMTAADEAPSVSLEWTGKLASAAGEMPKGKPIGAYSQIPVHPLFFKSREPFVPPPPPPPPTQAAAPPPPPVDPGLILGGVAIARDVRKAYLFTAADPKGTWVSEGEMFMGWKIGSVTSTSTTLQQQDRVIELELYGRR